MEQLQKRLSAAMASTEISDDDVEDISEAPCGAAKRPAAKSKSKKKA
jgi:hypothetical protein